MEIVMSSFECSNYLFITEIYSYLKLFSKLNIIYYIILHKYKMYTLYIRHTYYT